MKQNRGVIFRIITILAIAQLFVGCLGIEHFEYSPWYRDKIDYKPYERTALGRNTLFVTLNGETITQHRSGHTAMMEFIKDGEVYWVTDYSYAAFNIDEDGKITIRALLESTQNVELQMKLPVKDIVEGVTYEPEVSLLCLYLPEIYAVRIVNDQTLPYSTRRAVYHKATVTDAKITIGTYYPEGDSAGRYPYRPVLSGEFSFSGHYTDSLGTDIPIKARDGFFDVSDIPGISAPADKANWPGQYWVYEE